MNMMMVYLLLHNLVRVKQLLYPWVKLTALFVHHHRAKHAIPILVIFILQLWHLYEVLLLLWALLTQYIERDISGTSLFQFKWMVINPVIQVILASLSAQIVWLLQPTHGLGSVPWTHLVNSFRRYPSGSTLCWLTDFFNYTVPQVFASSILLLHLLLRSDLAWERTTPRWDGAWLDGLVLLILTHGVHHSVQVEVNKLLIGGE